MLLEERGGPKMRKSFSPDFMAKVGGRVRMSNELELRPGSKVTLLLTIFRQHWEAGAR
jgi:hypothetical protein